MLHVVASRCLPSMGCKPDNRQQWRRPSGRSRNTLAGQIEADSGLTPHWSLPTIGVGGGRNDPRAIVTVALFCIVFELLTFNNIVTLKSRLGITQMSLKFIGNGTIRSIKYEFLLAVHSVCLISETKQDIGRKSRFFHTPPALDALDIGSPSEYCHNVWYGKIRMVVYQMVKKSLRTCLLVSTQYTNVTDTQPDTR